MSIRGFRCSLRHLHIFVGQVGEHVATSAVQNLLDEHVEDQRSRRVRGRVLDCVCFVFNHLSNVNPRLIPLGCLTGGHHLSRFFYINLSLFGGTNLIHQPGFVNPMVMDSTDEKLIIPT